jgi:type II secretory pathway pseudopilin PulG
MNAPDHRRRGATLIEIFVVLAIILGLSALSLPALQYARESARRAQCQSNLHQLDLAMNYFLDARGRLPNAPQSGTMSGWAIEILPFLEENALANGLAGSPPFNFPAALALAGNRPAIMSCPSSYEGASNTPPIPVSHYTTLLIRHPKRSRNFWVIGELPIDSRVAWVTSPEQRPGGAATWMPHGDGYFQVNGGGLRADAVQFIIHVDD